MMNSLEISKDSLQLILKDVKNQLEDTSTTKLLIGGVVVVSSTYFLQIWVKQMIKWKLSEINGPMPIPLIGSVYIFLKKGLINGHKHLEKNYGKTFILFEGPSVQPAINTSDENLIKAITIKDFHIFRNRRIYGGMDNIVPLDKFMTLLKDDHWKNVRAIMSTGFSTGKIKNMTSTLLETCSQFDRYLENLIAKDEDFNIKEAYSRFALDVAFSCFFGYSIDTVNNPDSQISKAIKIFFKSFKGFKFLLILLFPRLGGYLMKTNWISMLDEKNTSFLMNMTTQILNERRSGSTRRNDFLQILIDHASNDSRTKRTLTDDEIMSQLILFKIAGTDTVATALSYVSYNLATHSEYQEKLIKEIDTVIEKHNGEISYDAVNEMTFLSDVINETQRMYSVSVTDRVAAEDYEFNGIRIKKNQCVIILLDNVHHNEQTYNNSTSFKPERQKSNDSFYPFGNGPRNCIAQRFALIEMKLLLTKILTKYRFVKCERTCEKAIPDDSGLAVPKVPIYLKVVKR